MTQIAPATDPWCLWLRQRMTALGLDPKMLAKQLGLSRQAIYWTMHDGGPLPPNTRISRLAIVLGCSEEEVLRMRGAAWEHRGTPFGQRVRNNLKTPAGHTSKRSGAA